ncbi:hypothetical protein DFP72DRAFT_1098622 [Ephemerocybe angulata]|uniref:Uncharacterized protein n=1 Tax=Ephemerocybe angulata TaxID=980116 RepID=A0A8H6M8F4_9AGAR|nr:hypothetical protein DFP72DRAFT_1098622 [Tulosesus angulatus]
MSHSSNPFKTYFGRQSRASTSQQRSPPAIHETLGEIGEESASSSVFKEKASQPLRRVRTTIASNIVNPELTFSVNPTLAGSPLPTVHVSDSETNSDTASPKVKVKRTPVDQDDSYTSGSDLSFEDNPPHKNFPTLSEGEKWRILVKLGIDDLVRLQDATLIPVDTIGKVLFERAQYLLEDFGMQRKDVLAMLKWTESIISGSFVLAILYPGMFVPGDIDIYAAEPFLPSVKAFISKLGYSKSRVVFPWKTIVDVSSRPQTNPSTSKASPSNNVFDNISQILEFRNDGGQKINLILSVSVAILPLMQFHSTIVQNYVAFHGVVVLHRQTLSRIGLINIPAAKIPARTLRCLVKYEQRGFKMWKRLMIDHQCNVDDRCAQTMRSLFDEHVFHFKFPKPVVFVKSTYVLFEKQEEEELKEVMQGFELKAEAEDEHVPTAERVLRVFSGAFDAPPMSSDSEDDDSEGDEEDGFGELEEIDFNDRSKLMEVDTGTAAPGKESKKAQKKANLGTAFLAGGLAEGGEEEVPYAAAETAIEEEGKLEVDDADIVVVVEQMHAEDRVEGVEPEETKMTATTIASQAPTLNPVPDTVYATAAEEAGKETAATEEPPSFVIDTEPTPIQENAHEASDNLDFVIDTKPAPIQEQDYSESTITKPRIAMPPPILLSDDDEVIVYVAPHPRKSELEESTSVPKPKVGAFTPYAPDAREQDEAARSTPRMAKYAMAKQWKLAACQRKRQGVEDEFGFESVDERRGERRRGDSDLEWGDEDEEEQGVGLDVKGEDARGESGCGSRGDNGEDDEDGEEEFTLHKASTASKRRDRRKRATAAAAASFLDSAADTGTPGPDTARSRRRARRTTQQAEQVLAAMDMAWTRSWRDAEAMKAFANGMLGRDADHTES